MNELTWRLDEWMINGWINEWMKRRLDQWMINEWINEWINEKK